VLGLGVAAVALNGGTLLALAIADPSVGRAFGAAVSLALLLAWLFWPAPVSEDAALGWLLSPEPSRPLWAAIMLRRLARRTGRAQLPALSPRPSPEASCRAALPPSCFRSSP
jgi:hypothetical protein